MNLVQGPYDLYSENNRFSISHHYHHSSISSTSSASYITDLVFNSSSSSIEQSAMMYNVGSDNIFNSLPVKSTDNNFKDENIMNTNISINNFGSHGIVSPIARQRTKVDPNSVRGKFSIAESCSPSNFRYEPKGIDSTLLKASQKVDCNKNKTISSLDNKISSIYDSDSSFEDVPLDSCDKGVVEVSDKSLEVTTSTTQPTTTSDVAICEEEGVANLCTKTTSIESTIVDIVVETPKKRKNINSVRFAEEIEFREYSITVGEHPYCKDGLAITLDWDSAAEYSLPFDIICKERNVWYTPPSKLTYTERCNRLQEVSPESYEIWHTKSLLLATSSSNDNNSTSIQQNEEQSSLNDNDDNDDDDEIHRVRMNVIPQSSDLSSIITMLQLSLSENKPIVFPDIVDDHDDDNSIVPPRRYTK